MNKSLKIIFIAIGATVTGFCYFAWQHHWIILNIPWNTTIESQTVYTKKKCIIHLWRQGTWTQESVELLWSQREPFNVQQLTQAAFSLLAEEYATKQKVVVEQVLMHHDNQQLLIFLNNTPLEKNMSIHIKLMIIESVLKTLRANDIKTPWLNFLVHNQPLGDTHLSFTQPWPLAGFVNAKT
jgi:hypothetical protein